MSMVLEFLNHNRQRFGLARYGAHGQLTALTITPRFQASSHVVFLIWGEDSTKPVLVAKLPRLREATASIEREVTNLRLVQALRPTGFASVPEVVAYETYQGYPILIETALTGQPMDPAYTSRHRDRCSQAITDWLTTIQQPVAQGKGEDPRWFERLVERPLHYFEARFPVSASEIQLLRQTWALVEPLRTQPMPLVFEHGDLSYPNLMLLPNGDPGVLDWELADPAGLPACDLFLFLTYAAFATQNARATGQYETAFATAFFTPNGWTQPYLRCYAERLQLPSETLTALFVLTWLRYIVSQLVRLDDGNYLAADQVTPCDPQTAAWLRQNRYYALWHYAVHHVEQLQLGVSP
ncbi:MAG: aminoglycoside phosphotransferase family protein [Caldilineaceae bacterium]|nr:aminoglycoside phosphotransferase family protein [Caldilineaceae bacterium]